MNTRRARRLLGGLMAVCLLLGTVPGGSLRALAAEPFPAPIPPEDQSKQDADSYSMFVYNLDPDLINLDGGMFLGYPGNNVTDPYSYPAFAHRPQSGWGTSTISSYGKSIRLGSGMLTRYDFVPFGVTTQQRDNKPTVPVLAMVDSAALGRLTNTKTFDFKKWANSLTTQSYDKEYPWKGAMLAPLEVTRGYVHAYDNYPSDPVNVISYGGNVAEAYDEDGNAQSAQTQALVAGAVLFEPNALQLKVTGTERVELDGQKNMVGNYAYAGGAQVLAEVTNTASYPVLARIDFGEPTVAYAEDGTPDGKRFPVEASQHNGEVLYLAAGETAYAQLTYTTSPNNAYFGSAFAQNVTSACKVTVTNLTNQLGSAGVKAEARSASLSTVWPGSGEWADNVFHLTGNYEYNYQVNSVTPAMIQLDDVSRAKSGYDDQGNFNPQPQYIENQITITGGQMNRVKRVLVVIPVYDPHNGRTGATSWGVEYPAPHPETGRRYVVLTYSADRAGSGYDFNFPSGSVEPQEISQDRWYKFDSQSYSEIKLTIPHEYFDQSTENMLKEQLKNLGLSESIDIYVMADDERNIIPCLGPKADYGQTLYNYREATTDEEGAILREPDARIMLGEGYAKYIADQISRDWGTRLYMIQTVSPWADDSYIPTTVLSKDGGTVEQQRRALLTFTGSQVTNESGYSPVGGKPYDIRIDAGCILNNFAYVYGWNDEAGIFIKKAGGGYEVWSEGCSIYVQNSPVMTNFRIDLTDLNKKWYVSTTDPAGEFGMERDYQKIKMLLYNPAGGAVSQDERFLDNGFLKGDIHFAYLYNGSMGLNLTVEDPQFLPFDVEDIGGLGKVEINLEEFRMPISHKSQPEMKTAPGGADLSLGRDYFLFEAGAGLHFEADTLPETPPEERYMNITGGINLFNKVQVDLVAECKYTNGIYVFNKLYVSGASDAVGLPPLFPILELSQIGGGIDGLTDTINHQGWNYIPPLTVNLDASVAFSVRVVDLGLDRVGIVVGPSKLGMYADALSIGLSSKDSGGGEGGEDEDEDEDEGKSIQILQNMAANLSWDLQNTDIYGKNILLPVFRLDATGEASLLDIATGGGSILYVLNTSEFVKGLQAYVKDSDGRAALEAWLKQYEQTGMRDDKGLYDTMLRVLFPRDTEQMLSELFVKNGTLSIDGQLWGNVHIPNSVPFVGGYELADGTVGVSYYAPKVTMDVSGGYDVFFAKGVAGVTFTYNVFSGKFDHSVYTRSMAESPQTVTLNGVNMRAVEEVYSLRATAYAAPDEEVSPVAAVTGGGKEFTLTSEAGDDVVLVEFLAPAATDISIRDGDIEHMVVAEDANWVEAQTEEGRECRRYTFAFCEDDGKGVTRSIHGKRNEPAHTWTITANDTLISCQAAAIDPPEALSDASWIVVSNQIKFSADHLRADGSYTADVYLVRKEAINSEGKPEETGTLVMSGARVTEGENTLPLPDNVSTLVQSGSYRAVVYLVRTDGGVPTRLGTLAVSDGSVSIMNPNAPWAITESELTLSYLGNGGTALTFPAPEDGKTAGYEFTATDGDGNPILIPRLDEKGAPTGELVDAFAAPVDYPLADVLQPGGGTCVITLAPDSRLDTGHVYDLRLTPYSEPEGSSMRIYGPATVVDDFQHTEAQPTASSAQVDTGVWLAGAPDTLDPETARYLAQEQIGLTVRQTGTAEAPELELIETPVETSVSFITAEAVNAWTVTATGAAFAQAGEDGSTASLTKVFRSAEEGFTPGAQMNRSFSIPLRAGEYLFRVETVNARGDTSVQRYRFLIDGAGPVLTADFADAAFMADDDGGNQRFTFTASLTDGDSKIVRVGNADVDLLPDAQGYVTWTGDPGVTRTVLATEDGTPTGTPTLSGYTIPVTARSSSGATKQLIYTYNLAPGANKPIQLSLSTTLGSTLSTASDGAVMTARATTLSGFVLDVDNGNLTFEVLDPATNAPSAGVLSVAADGAVTVHGTGSAIVKASYTIDAGVPGEEYTITATLAVEVAGTLPTALRVTGLSHDSVQLELGALPGAASVLVEQSADGGSTYTETATLTTGFESAQTVTAAGLTPMTDYQFRATPTGGGYAPATAYAATPAAPEPGAVYSVTYDYGDADGGAAPVDPNLYAAGEEVPLMDSRDRLTRNGVQVLGFSTAPDGGGTKLLYADVTGSFTPSFTMGSGNATLYPIWTSGGGTSGGGGGSSAEPAPTFPGGKGWDGAEKALAGLKEGARFRMELNGAAKVPAGFLNALAGLDVTVELDLGGGAVWVLRGTDLPEDGSLTALDLGLRRSGTAIPDGVLSALAGDKAVIRLTLSHDGPFPFPLTLRLELGGEHGGKWANLYYYSASAKALEFRASARADAKGVAELPFDHASSYAVILDSVSHAAWQNPFTDVKEADWFYDAVRTVCVQGLMTGTSDTTFSPGVETSRAMAATLLWRLAGEPAPKEAASFPDVEAGSWYADAAAWAGEAGVVKGYDSGLFAPGDPVTREQLASLLYRFAQAQGLDVSVGENTNILSYTDAFDVSEWAVPALQWACGAGVIQGKDGGRLAPGDSATRAELAALFQRYLPWTER